MNHIINFDKLNQQLEELSTTKQTEFSSKIIPGSKPILGVKIPALRVLAKSIAKENYRYFLENCPDVIFEHRKNIYLFAKI